jgi:phosphoglycolate phosphatase
LARFGIDEQPANLKHFIGPPLHHSFMSAYRFDSTQARQAVEYYREYFGATGIFENVLFPCIPDLLARLQADGRRLCVVTSKPAFYAEQIVRHFALDGFFDAVVGADMELQNTEKPGLVKDALLRYPALQPRQAVMVGDREHDIIGARANGVDAIAVTYGAGSREELVAAQPACIVDSITELRSALGV